ncbi:hypothetical protein D3C80_1277270 [compost metagenome]
MRQQRAVGVAGLADLPAALAVSLQEEHVVVVEMRPYTAARGGIADHDIVDAPARQEAELLEQFGNFRDELVDSLHQQGPVALRQGLKVLFLERAAAQFPGAVAMLDDDARLDHVFQGQAGEFVGAEWAVEFRQGLADQQGFLLPVIAEEFVGADAAQNLKRSIRIHW